MPRAPGHLRPETRQWWNRYAATHKLREPQLRLLTMAGEAWDRSIQARLAVEEEGLIYRDRFGQPRPRPEVAMEKEAKLLFERLLRALAQALQQEEAQLPEWLKGGLRFK